ncbi:MAG TPA: adenosylmethionine--8-amino-7-oxononanoate transaminase, partial [Firmicutes bacterium]|nr:adenosylmethionine--8-amino-7-oxononanoate transaminase [Bacillota bacterium]
NAAIVQQLDKIAHSTMLGLANVPSILLAKRLVNMTPPGLTKVFYSDAGATAVEIALKMSFQYWQQQNDPNLRRKKKYLSLGEAYHGDTIGSVSLGGMDLFNDLFRDLLFSGYRACHPYCYRCSLNLEQDKCGLACVDAVEDIMSKHHEELAAMIVEPLVQGAAGMIIAPKGYLRRIRELCTKYNILLIADEVAVGFGRTGTMFACEQEDVCPDLICLAKGLTGGYLPLAATLTSERIYEAFLGEHKTLRAFSHGHTYTGNPLGCVAALANLDLFEKNDLLTHVHNLARVMAEQLERFHELAHVGDIRQRGLMVGIELVRNKQTKEAYLWEENIGHQVILEARKHGLIIRPLGSVIVLMPILNISESQLMEILNITYQAIKTVTERNEMG